MTAKLLARVLLVVASASLISRTAVADDVLPRFALRAEGGVGTMFSEHQIDVLQYNSANFEGSLRVAFNVIDMLALQVSVTDGVFLSPLGTGGLTLWSAGLRFEPRAGSFGRVWLDVNLGYALTGGFDRFGFDVGAGFEFNATRFLAVGPFVRFGETVQDHSDPNPEDAVYWFGGFSATLRAPQSTPLPPPAPAPVEASSPPPADRDQDGVPDDVDSCPDEPAGAHPDPARPGCPLRDTDFDGVFDDADVCPAVPQGSHPDPTRAGCPDPDTDNDGITDHSDACPTQVPGWHPDPARPGCPLPDRDHDGVPDAEDHCPDRPGAPDPNPARNGCPGLVRIENDQIVILQRVFFATGSDRILARSNRLLTAVASALRFETGIHRLTIEGHTDSVGNADANTALSQRRAESVMRWLVAHAIEASRLEAHGYGPTRPLAPNTSSAGRARNRRVELHIIDDSSSSPSP